MMLMLSGEGKTDMGRMLRDLLGHETSAEEQAEWIKTGRIDPFQINMPSFKAFHNELTRAVRCLPQSGS